MTPAIFCNIAAVDQISQEFSRWVLSDLARRASPRNTTPIEWRGNHVKLIYEKPVRNGDEALEEYFRRVDAWRDGLPRGSDNSLRLALAVQSYQQSGEFRKRAIGLVLDDIDWAKIAIGKEITEMAALGIQFRLPDGPLGTTDRSNNKKLKKTEPDSDVRRAEVVRTQVSRYRKNHRNFDDIFAMWFEVFIAEHHCDSAWLAKVEPVYRERVTRAASNLDPNDPWLGTNTLNLARLLHEMGKYGEAELLYLEAQQQWGTLEFTNPRQKERRSEVMEVIANGLKACRTGI